jgi:hypothetical protein
MRPAPQRSLVALVVAAIVAAGAAWAAPPVLAADTVPPLVGAPSASPAKSRAVTSKKVAFAVSWPAGTDVGRGIARYRLQLRIDGGSWQRVDLPGATARRVVIELWARHDQQLRVRAVDRAGNAGPWSEGPTFRVGTATEASHDLATGGSWSTRAKTAYLGGSALRSRTTGSTATFSFTGSAIAWIAAVGPTRGRADLVVDGVSAGSVDLWAPSTAYRRVVFRRAWASSGPHTLRIRVAGTAGRPLVEVDGFVVAEPPPADPTLVGAGDVSYCSLTGDARTAALLDRIAGTVFVAGDVAYPDGTKAQFRECYGPTWGRWKLRTRPVPGNHEYHSTGAAPYFAYFGARAGPAGAGWYAYDLGAWRIYGLNSNCDEVACGAGSAQERWLRADLAAHPRACVAAVWHHPLFSSGEHGSNPAVAPLWRALEEAGADVVLNGHDHDYERFAPQTWTGASSASGMREFVVGTGGAALRPFPRVTANSVVRNASTHGVLRLTLQPTGYDWAFVPVAGGTFTDAGSADCH